MSTALLPTDRVFTDGVARFCERAGRCPDLEAIRGLLNDPGLDLGRLAGLASFESGRYTRRVLFQDDRVSVLLLGWLPGQASEIHDHGGSACCFRVLRGVAVEGRYEVDADGDAVEVSRDAFLPGSVLGCDGTDIHAIANEAGADEPLVTLHVYRPAPVMRYFKRAEKGEVLS